MEDQIVISVAAGKTLSMIETALMSINVAGKLKVVRAMPNTPALVGEAMTAITPNANLNEEDIAKVKALFESFGQVEVVPESMMNAVIGVSGSSPAFIYMLIEAMADAAVVEGMPRAQAYKFAAQSVLGSAKMVLETGMHPGALKDAVCSPGGTTIAGVEALEQCGFRGTVMEGIRATVAKAEEMSK
jgi:pyrroline-5-carboxylate reductase